MSDNKNYRVLLTRNRISLLLDDLVYEIRNSKLADQFRQLSNEIVKYSPGFTFDGKKATKLENKVADTLSRLRSGQIREFDLLDVMEHYRCIIQGENKEESGGYDMGIISKIFKSADQKLKEQQKALEESIAKIEKACRETSEKISHYKELKKKAVEDVRSCSPDSIKYREAHRAFDDANDNLKLLEQQYKKLDDAAIVARRKLTILNQSIEAKKTGKMITEIGVDDETLDTAIVTIETLNEELEEYNKTASANTSALFDSIKEVKFEEDSEFSQAVALDQRQQAILKAARAADNVNEPDDEFNKMVQQDRNAANKQETNV